MWQLALSACIHVAPEIERGYLTDFFKETGQFEKRPGPHTALADHQILDRREKFVQVFEGLWGEIGWELHKCKKETDVVRALCPLNEIAFIRELASVFFHESEGPISAATLRECRAELRRAQQSYRDAEVSKQLALAQLERLDAALAEARPSERRVIKQTQEERQKETFRGIQRLQDLSRSQKELQVLLKGLEAGFARQEILKFCKSKRYELTPLNLANAIAGLPYMGWRQSMRRSMKQPRMVADGLDYQLFKAIRYISAKVKKLSENSLVAEFAEGIRRLPIRYRAPRDKLANQWFFLERAIHTAFKSKPHPRAFPFEIAKHYFREIRSRSQVDRILAQQAELSLSRQK
jgi:hypothetical protein